MMTNRRFLAQHHLRKSVDFQRAYRRRCRVADRRIIVFGYSNGLPHPRLGISASRRLGNAVVRNRWKRLLREAFRLSRPQLPEGVDLIIIPCGEPPSLELLRKSLVRLASLTEKKLN